MCTVRVGGGFMKFEEWIQRFGRKEGLMIAGGICSSSFFIVIINQLFRISERSGSIDFKFSRWPHHQTYSLHQIDCNFEK